MLTRRFEATKVKLGETLGMLVHAQNAGKTASGFGHDDGGHPAITAY